MNELKYNATKQTKNKGRKKPIPKKGDRHDFVEIIQFLGYKPKKGGTTPMFEILCHKCNQKKEISEGNYRRVKTCGCAEYETKLKNLNDARRNKVSEHKRFLNQELENKWTLTKFDDSKRSEKKLRIMDYTLECPNGHTLDIKSTHLSPSNKASQKPCWCQEENPFIKERRRNQLSLQEVATRFGVSRQAVNLWESPNRLIPNNRFIQLTDLYETSDDVKQEMYMFQLGN